MSHFTSDFSYLPIWIIFTLPEVVRKIKIPPSSAIHPVTHVSIDPAKIVLVSRPCEQFFPILLYMCNAVFSWSSVHKPTYCLLNSDVHDTPLNASFSALANFHLAPSPSPLPQ